MLEFLPLLDGTSFNWALRLHSFGLAFFLASFLQKNGLCNFFDFPITALRFFTLTLIFFDHIFKIPYIFANRYWQRLWLTGAEIFGKRKSFAYDFLEKIFENPGFFTRQLSLCRLLWSSFFFTASQGWLRLGIKNVGWIQEFSVKCSDFFARC